MSGIIVIKYLALPDYDKNDSELVAKAVQRLDGIKAPSLALGPAAGGPAVHLFFLDWDARITYKTVGGLEEHIDGVS